MVHETFHYVQPNILAKSKMGFFLGVERPKERGAGTLRKNGRQCVCAWHIFGSHPESYHA